MKITTLLALLFLVSCNPELAEVGANPNDLVKYFKLTKSQDPKALGEGVLIIAHAGDKRILTYYLKTQSGSYAHTDVTITTKNGFFLDSVYSKTKDCQLNPDVEQPDVYNYLRIEGENRPYKLEILEREAAMGMLGSVSC